MHASLEHRDRWRLRTDGRRSRLSLMLPSWLWCWRRCLEWIAKRLANGLFYKVCLGKPFPEVYFNIHEWGRIYSIGPYAFKRRMLLGRIWCARWSGGQSFSVEGMWLILCFQCRRQHVHAAFWVGYGPRITNSRNHWYSRLLPSRIRFWGRLQQWV